MLKAWGLAAFLSGHDAESDDVRSAPTTRIWHRRIEDACLAFWLGLAATLRGQPTRGAVWFARIDTTLDDHGLATSVWHGFVLVPPSHERVLRRRFPPLPSADEGSISAAFPAWDVVDARPAPTTGMPKPLRKAEPRFYVLRRSS